jgi:hypothetical protein
MEATVARGTWGERENPVSREPQPAMPSLSLMDP